MLNLPLDPAERELLHGTIQLTSPLINPRCAPRCYIHSSFSQRKTTAGETTFSPAKALTASHRIVHTHLTRPSHLLTAHQMALNGAAGSADLRTQEETVHNKSTEETYFTRNTSPRALREALQLANSGKISTPSESASEEDYDEQSQKPIAVLRLNRKREKNQAAAHPTSGSKSKASEGTSEVATPSSASSENGTLEDVASLRGAKVYTIASDDKELREILRRGMQRVSTEVSRVVKEGS